MVFYNTEPISPNEIAARIVEDFSGGEGETPGVYLRAHKTTPWEVISPIVEQCGAAKIAVQMVTKPLESNAAPGAPWERSVSSYLTRYKNARKCS